MTDHRFLIPSSTGLIVRDPVNKSILSPDGMLKPWTGKQGTYWRRRVACGDCLILEN